MKLIWKSVKNPRNLWVNLVSKKYLKNYSVLDYTPSSNFSWQWKKLMSIRDVFKKGLMWIVNSGDSISFWDDNWVFLILFRVFSPRLLGWKILRSIGLLMMLDNGTRFYWRIQFLRILLMPLLGCFFQLLWKMMFLSWDLLRMVNIRLTPMLYWFKDQLLTLNSGFFQLALESCCSS